MIHSSGGQGESLLTPDQDNALVFAEGAPDSAADRWFACLARFSPITCTPRRSSFCKGGVMARNLVWRGSAAEWRRRVDGWVVKARAEDLLNVDIFYDLRWVHGDEDLVAELCAYAWEQGSQRVEFAKLLGESVRDIGDPFTIFGGLRVQEGRLDLKLHGLFPIAAATRALEIHHHVARASTDDRLAGLAELPGAPRADFAMLQETHRFFTSLVLDQQVADIALGVPPGNSVVPDRLSSRRQKTLKEALKSVGIISQLVRSAMFF